MCIVERLRRPAAACYFPGFLHYFSIIVIYFIWLPSKCIFEVLYLYLTQLVEEGCCCRTLEGSPESGLSAGRWRSTRGVLLTDLSGQRTASLSEPIARRASASADRQRARSPARSAARARSSACRACSPRFRPRSCSARAMAAGVG